MGFLTRKAMNSINKYMTPANSRYGSGSHISNRLNKEIGRLAEKEILRAESKLIDKASKEISKIGINPNDLLSEDSLRNPRGALTRVARNKIETELVKAGMPPELLNPEIIKNPKEVLSSYALNQIGNELEKHKIPRELLNPEIIKNPGPFLKDYTTDKLNSRLAKYDIPPELVNDLLSGKIKTQQDVLMSLKAPITNRINSELNEKLSNVRVGKTNLANIVGTISNNLNESMAASDLILYATNKDVIGTNNKIANSSMESDSPAVSIASKTILDNTSAKESILQYPLGKESKQCCYCIISAFEYEYDPNDILGNKRALDNEIAPRIKNLYEIRLPMPASLASTFSANWSEYTSVWSKLLRSGSINITEGMSINPKDWVDKMVDLYQDNPAVKDTVKVGGMAAVMSLASGNGFSAIGDGINESLNYLRVAGGLTINPMTQATYVAANIRNHKFSFNMIPRNKEEQIAITKIIKLLEDSQLAARRNDMGGILLDFPDTFNIRFVAPDGSPINGVLEVPDSVITSINVTRSNSLPAFKVTKDFFPISYNLEINFKEMQNLVRQDLKYLRQSTEQFKAFHSGGKIPADWDPNNAMKDIKPFDIGTAASGSTNSESSNSTGSIVPNEEIEATRPNEQNMGGKTLSNYIDKTKRNPSNLVSGNAYYYPVKEASSNDLTSLPNQYRADVSDSDSGQIHKSALAAYEKMINDMPSSIKSSESPKISSAFRSIASTSKTGTNSRAPAGYSEHHSGLAIDITTTKGSHRSQTATDNFKHTQTYKWLMENGSKYGFTLTYPPNNKQGVLPGKGEPWHWVYTG